jgi:hypothetical protein
VRPFEGPRVRRSIGVLLEVVDDSERVAGRGVEPVAVKRSPRRAERSEPAKAASFDRHGPASSGFSP